MNRGFKKYYKEAIQQSSSCFKKKKNLVSYYTYFFSTLILKILFFIFYPLYRAMDHRMGRQIRKGEPIRLNQIFDKTDNSKDAWTSATITLELIFRFLFKFIVISIPFGALLFLEYMINIQVGSNTAFYVAFIPTLAVYIIFIIRFFFRSFFNIQPISYLIECSDSLKKSDILDKSFKATNQEGKGTIFLLYFIPLLIKALLISSIIIIYLMVNMLLSNIMLELIPLVSSIFVIVIVIVALIVLRFLPVFTLTTRIGLELLFDDILFKKPSHKRIIIDKKFKAELVRKSQKDELVKSMTKMFDEQVDLDKSFKEEDNLINELKENEETKDFFNDARVVDSITSLESENVTKSSFQKVVESFDRTDSITKNQAEEIDNLINQNIENENKPIEDETTETKETSDVQSEAKEIEVKEETLADNTSTDTPNETLAETKEELKEEIKEEPLVESKEETKEEPKENVVEEAKEEPKKKTTRKRKTKEVENND